MEKWNVKFKINRNKTIFHCNVAKRASKQKMKKWKLSISRIRWTTDKIKESPWNCNKKNV